MYPAVEALEINVIEHTIFILHKSLYRTFKRGQRLPGASTVRLGRAAVGTARCRYQKNSRPGF